VSKVSAAVEPLVCKDKDVPLLTIGVVTDVVPATVAPEIAPDDVTFVGVIVDAWNVPE
jgi:hypothetical protein